MYGSWNPTASYDTTVFEDYATEHRFDMVNQLGMWVPATAASSLDPGNPRAAPSPGPVVAHPARLVPRPPLGRPGLHAAAGEPQPVQRRRAFTATGWASSSWSARRRRWSSRFRTQAPRLGDFSARCSAFNLWRSSSGQRPDYFVPGGTGWNDNVFLFWPFARMSER